MLPVGQPMRTQAPVFLASTAAMQRLSLKPPRYPVEQSFVKYANIYYSIASSHYAKGLQSNYANYSAAAV